MNISSIIIWKYGSGTCDFMVRNGELIWEDKNISKPTESELNSWNTELIAEETVTQYQRDRQYPSIGDQLDMQYHDQLNGTTTWQDAVAKVKSDNPK
jgi:hypothetical protein